MIPHSIKTKLLNIIMYLRYLRVYVVDEWIEYRSNMKKRMRRAMV
jgi:hypothetical protein